MRQILFTATIFLSVLTGFAQQTIELNNWKFSKGDNMDWAKPGFDDSAWKPIQVGKDWQSQEYPGYEGYGWYRIKFNLPSSLKMNSFYKDSVRIILGKIDDIEQTFLNGYFLGQNAKLITDGNAIPEKDMTQLDIAWDVTRIYTVAANDPRLKWDQENTLAIRVINYTSGGGLYTLPVNIRMRDILDYLVFDPDSKTFVTQPNGMVCKTVVLKNHSPFTRLKGKLQFGIINKVTNQVVFSQTKNIILKKDSDEYNFVFKENLLRHTKINYSFIESKSGNKINYIREPDCTGGWLKYRNSPVLGGDLGTIFDVCVLKNDNGTYQMYCSWRNKRSIALSESKDGLHWSEPEICFTYNEKSGWENDVNRPVIVKKDGLYHMWYTGQTGADTDWGKSWIGFATSIDGKNWIRKSDKPVLSAELSWEKGSVMCPHVIWDEQEHLFKMWYSAGGQIEADAIGYATSKDGMNWEKYLNKPVFTCNKQNAWEEGKTVACQIIKRENDYLMFYIGFPAVGYNARIGMARSKDGITNWERFSDNPIIRAGQGWDGSATYKPYVLPDPENNRWLLYYNGRRYKQEQIGIAIHRGMNLEF